MQFGRIEMLIANYFRDPLFILCVNLKQKKTRPVSKIVEQGIKSDLKSDPKSDLKSDPKLDPIPNSDLKSDPKSDLIQIQGRKSG